ncbi:MAG: LPS assembly protein LptD [Rhizobiales bacterium]|nr:LPS assembly protein LptD [Hyphomicrobiales bacterium]
MRSSTAGHSVPQRLLAFARLLVWLAAGLLLAPAIPQISTANPALAQTSLLPSGPELDPKNPMLLQADELIYDNQSERVVARGNVEIYFNNYTLLADQVAYNQGANTLEAVGNVRIKEPNGAIVNADRITLTDDFRDGFIGSLRIVTKEDARIAAALATRQDGETTIFERGVFTPCKPCKDDPERAPLWRLKAAKIIHKQAEGNIYYEDAALEFFGVPVVWLPYFYHADPSVKRRSGFLIPKVGSSSELGFYTEVPYFWELAPNMDVTLSPRYMTNQGTLWKGEFRHRLSNGAYSVNVAGIYQDDGTLTSSGDLKLAENDWRGSLHTEGRFSLGSYWNAGWDLMLESDDTFRRFFKLDNVLRTDRISKAYIEGMNDRNYFGAHLYHFGGLLADDNSNSESRVHPLVDYNYVFADPVLGGELSFDGNITSLSREGDTDSSRVLAQVKWRRQLIDEIGQVFTPFAQLRGDIYKVSSYDDVSTIDPNENDLVARGFGIAGLEYSYPFVAHTERASHIVEPVAQIIARPNDIDQQGVPNEDARSFVFDDTLLFDTDKFSGYDRIETGVRANVGVRYTMQMEGRGYARAVFGQSYHLSGDNPFDPRSGLETDTSDYIAGLYIEPAANFRLLAQARFDESDFDLRRQDIGAYMNYGPAALTLNYALSRGTPIEQISAEELATLTAGQIRAITEDQQELIANGTLRVAEFWSVLGGLRYDIEEELALTTSAGLKYSDECFTLAVTYSERNYRDRDIEPDQTVSIRFELKHLGGTTFNTSIAQDLIASEGGDD